MKKSLKIILSIIGVIILCFILDFIWIFNFNKPLFAIAAKQPHTYLGLFYDTYNCPEYSMPQIKSKGTKFACAFEEPENQEHSFYGTILESYPTYMIVKPNEGEEERNSSDKFHIDLTKTNDILYKVGANVKITYNGFILESYPAQINATKIEVITDYNFKIKFTSTKDNKVTKIIDKKNSEYDYNIYLIGGTVDITIDEKNYDLKTALMRNKINMSEIINKANIDFPNTPTYDDGGSVEYHYKDYTIIKLNTINNNHDVYIGNNKITINDIK